MDGKSDWNESGPISVVKYVMNDRAAFGNKNTSAKIKPDFNNDVDKVTVLSLA